MQNRLELLAYWVQKGMPEGAKYSALCSFNQFDIATLKNMPVVDLLDPFPCRYYDPPEQWIQLEPNELVMKILSQTKIRYREKTNSIDEAWNEWYPLGEEVPLIDVWQYEYQYLANTEAYNR